MSTLLKAREMNNITIIISVMVVLLLDVHSYRHYNNKMRYFSNLSLKSSNNNVVINDVVNQIKDPINKYMSIRKINNVDDFSTFNTTTVIKSYKDIINKNKKKESVFDMFKPSGWYKDKNEIDLNKRSDKSKAKIQHPLSYSELKKYGYEYLIDQIYQLGGPHACGKLLNIDWIEPVEIEIWDESLKPVTKESFTLDMRGELSLGLSFEDKLSLAENINIEKLKSQIEINNNNAINADPFYSTNIEDINYSNNIVKKRAKQIIVENEIVDYNEQYILSNTEKVYSILLCLSLSIAFGRATSQLSFIDSNDLRSLSTDFFIGLLITSIVSSLITIKESKDKQRNVFLWFLLGFAGGPAVIKRLKQLNVLEK